MQEWMHVCHEWSMIGFGEKNQNYVKVLNGEKVGGR